MSTLAVRESAYTATSDRQKQALRLVCEHFDLGFPARYQTGAGVVWLIFDDIRITLKDCAVLGALAQTIADVPNGVTTRQQLEDYVRSVVVLPKDITYSTSNQWQETLSANNAPVWLKADGSVPSGLTPVSE